MAKNSKTISTIYCSTRYIKRDHKYFHDVPTMCDSMGKIGDERGHNYRRGETVMITQIKVT